MQIEDSLLVKRSKAGELDAFEELIKRYESKVYTLAYRYIGNHDDANDIAQNAFIRAYQFLPSFRGDASFASWLYKITVNTSLDTIRKNNKHKDTSLDELMMQPKGNPSFETTALSPEKYLENMEYKDLVHRILNTLSRDHRIVLILREIQGLTYSEIAFCLGWPENTVKSNLHRARKALKEKIMQKRVLQDS